MSGDRVPLALAWTVARAYSAGPSFWAAAAEALDKKPYHQVLEELDSMYGADDGTDANYDVCFTFRVPSVDRRLCLSVVGPYAYVGRLTEHLSPDSADAVAALAEREGFTVLSPAELELPLRPWGPQGPQTVWQRLFFPESAAFG